MGLKSDGMEVGPGGVIVTGLEFNAEEFGVTGFCDGEAVFEFSNLDLLESSEIHAQPAGIVSAVGVIKGGSFVVMNFGTLTCVCSDPSKVITCEKLFDCRLTVIQ